MAYRFFSVNDGRVDRINYTVQGVSIITEGEAKGHNVEIDRTTLEQIASCAKQYKSGLKVKLDHGSGVESIVGTIKNFRIEGDKLLGDFYILKSHAKAAFLLDLIDNQPDTFGFSVHFLGDNEKREGKQFARCSEIYSVDLVSSPAANASGVFSAKEDEAVLALITPIKKMSDNTQTATVGDSTTVTFTAVLDESTGKYILEQPDFFLKQVVDKSEKSMAATNVKDTRAPIEKDKPVTTGLSSDDRISKLEEMFSKHIEEFKAYTSKDVKKDEETLSSEAKPDGEEPTKEPKKQEPVASYSAITPEQEKLIQQAVIQEFAKIGVNAIKANPENAAQVKNDIEKKFEDLIADEVAAGKSKIEAVKFCVQNHKEAHAKFLNNGGAHFN